MRIKLRIELPRSSYAKVTFFFGPSGGRHVLASRGSLYMGPDEADALIEMLRMGGEVVVEDRR